MRATAKLLGGESLWLVACCAFGMLCWVAVGSLYNESFDDYWTEHGVPPPSGTYATPYHLRFVLLFAPYVTSIVLRLLWVGTKRLRISAPIRAQP
jgi:hypothetical protein